VRCRFEKAFEFRERGVRHPPEEMISIPDHPQLIAELSLPLHFYRETGKLEIESKKALRQRGVASPDHAEALVLSFAPLAPGAAPTGQPRVLGGGARVPQMVGMGGGIGRLFPGGGGARPPPAW
jgi:phage terminase large subunit